MPEKSPDPPAPMSLQRRLIAYQTTRAWDEIPHVCYAYEPDITDFYLAFQGLQQDYRARGGRLTLNTLLLKTITEGLKAAPALNAYCRYDQATRNGTIERQAQINLSIPWLYDDHQMVPLTLFDAGSKGLHEMALAIESIQEKLKATPMQQLLTDTALGRHASTDSSRLSAADLLGGTVTVSNIGSICRSSGHIALLEILPPQVFAVGIAAMQEKPGVWTGPSGQPSIGIRKVLPMCLAFDHRVLDFIELVPFLSTLDAIFADPSILASW